MLIIKSGKIQRKGIEQPNQERIRILGEKENDKYLGILEADTIKQVEKNKRIRRVPQTNKALLQIYHQRDKHLGSPFCMILMTIFKMDQKTRKLMHKTSHLRDDINKLYVSRKEEEEDSPALKIMWMH